jgi:hypothetical protein
LRVSFQLGEHRIGSEIADAKWRPRRHGNMDGSP